jgi:hypothetical protein
MVDDLCFQLRDVWQSLVDTHPLETCEKPTASVDALKTILYATLDMIGLTGFGYDFDCLGREPGVANELHESLKVVFTERKISLRDVLGNYLPIIKIFVSSVRY